MCSTFLECSQINGIVLSQCNTRLRFLHLLYDIEVMWRKIIKHAFSLYYTLIKLGFLTNQIYIIDKIELIIVMDKNIL